MDRLHAFFRSLPLKSEVSIPTPTLICKILRRRVGEFQKSAAGHRVGTFASRSDLAAQMPIPICVCALVTQIARVLGLYSRGRRPGRVPAEVPRLPKVSPLGGYMQSGGLPFELENLSLVTGPFGALFLGWNRSALGSPGGVWPAAALVLPLWGSFFSLRPTVWTNLVL